MSANQSASKVVALVDEHRSVLGAWDLSTLHAGSDTRDESLVKAVALVRHVNVIERELIQVRVT